MHHYRNAVEVLHQKIIIVLTPYMLAVFHFKFMLFFNSQGCIPVKLYLQKQAAESSK